MEMFLMTAALAFLGVVVSVVLFAAAARDRGPVEAPRAVVAAERTATRFFADAPAAPTGVPVDVLLLQLEQHIRLEQAAAEAFLHAPTRQSLHGRTMSPLVH